MRRQLQEDADHSRIVASAEALATTAGVLAHSPLLACNGNQGVKRYCLPSS